MQGRLGLAGRVLLKSCICYAVLFLSPWQGQAWALIQYCQGARLEQSLPGVLSRARGRPLRTSAHPRHGADRQVSSWGNKSQQRKEGRRGAAWAGGSGQPWGQQGSALASREPATVLPGQAARSDLTAGAVDVKSAEVNRSPSFQQRCGVRGLASQGTGSFLKVL